MPSLFIGIIHLSNSSSSSGFSRLRRSFLRIPRRSFRIHALHTPIPMRMKGAKRAHRPSCSPAASPPPPPLLCFCRWGMQRLQPLHLLRRALSLLRLATGILRLLLKLKMGAHPQHLLLPTLTCATLRSQRLAVSYRSTAPRHLGKWPRTRLLLRPPSPLPSMPMRTRTPTAPELALPQPELEPLPLPTSLPLTDSSNGKNNRRSQTPSLPPPSPPQRRATLRC